MRNVVTSKWLGTEWKETNQQKVKLQNYKTERHKGGNSDKVNTDKTATIICVCESHWEYTRYLRMKEWEEWNKKYLMQCDYRFDSLR